MEAQRRKREEEAIEGELRERREQLEREMAEAAKAAREKAEKEAAEARAKAEREAAEAKAKAEKEAAEAKAKAEREAAEIRAKSQREAVEAKLREMRAAAAAKAKAEKEAAEAKERAERKAAEAKAKAEKEAAEKEAAAKAAAKKEADAKFAALKEAAAKKYAEKKARDAAAAKEAAEKANSTKGPASSSIPKSPASSYTAPRTPSPKKPQYSTSAANDEDSYSFKPYDRPRRPYAGTYASSVVSESSYTPSQSTAQTSPPPSVRGTYSTKDPDKIVIRGVFAFNNTYMQNPYAQLVSGLGMVTDGLVLRITTEGLFIDDDVRGVPQREWDVKAWTMKLFEVWCPQVETSPASARQSPNKSHFRRGMPHGVPTAEESEACLANLLKVCKNRCRSEYSPGDNGYSEQNLHVLRASLRDQEGKKYVFVIQENEGWKVPIGLQRLRGGTQVRALGVSNMPVNECKTLLSKLGHI